MPRVSYSRTKFNSAENQPSARGGWYCRVSVLASIALAFVLTIPLATIGAEDAPFVMAPPTVSLSIDEVDSVYKGGTHESNTVSVPVRIAGPQHANFVQLSVDYDRSRLLFRELRIEYGRWILWPGIPVVNNPEGRVVATLFDVGGGSRPALEEQGLHFVTLVFDLVPGNFPSDSYFVHSPLQFTPFNPMSLSQEPREETIVAHLDVENEDIIVRAVPADLDNGGVHIFYADAVEVGSGGITQRGQSVVLPLYVTHLSDIDFIGVGVDYDELILNLAAVRPQGIGNGGEGPPPPVSLSYRSNPPGADFRIDLRGFGQPATGYILRKHVADLVFHYSGPAEAGDGIGQGGALGDRVGGALEIQPSVRRPLGEGVAAANGSIRFLSGYLRILSPHFVRGNVDSSIFNYKWPENGLELALDSYRTAPDIGDPTAILRWLFWPAEGRQTINCMEAADVNDDGAVQIDDAVLLLHTLFIGGTEPAAPFPYPGSDPEDSPSNLGCDLPLPVFMGD